MAFLRANGDTHWSKLIDDDLHFIRKGDPYGAKRFVTYIGGMSSLNDLWLCRENGYSTPEDRVFETNKEAQKLVGRAFELARTALGSAA